MEGFCGEVEGEVRGVFCPRVGAEARSGRSGQVPRGEAAREGLEMRRNRGSRGFLRRGGRGAR